MDTSNSVCISIKTIEVNISVGITNACITSKKEGRKGGREGGGREEGGRRKGRGRERGRREGGREGGREEGGEREGGRARGKEGCEDKKSVFSCAYRLLDDADGFNMVGGHCTLPHCSQCYGQVHTGIVVLAWKEGEGGEREEEGGRGKGG